MIRSMQVPSPGLPLTGSPSEFTSLLIFFSATHQEEWLLASYRPRDLTHLPSITKLHSLLAPDACCRLSGHKSSRPVSNAAAWKDAVCKEHSLTNEGRMIMSVSLKQSVLNHIIISQRAVCHRAQWMGYTGIPGHQQHAASWDAMRR